MDTTIFTDSDGNMVGTLLTAIGSEQIYEISVPTGVAAAATLSILPPSDFTRTMIRVMTGGTDSWTCQPYLTLASANETPPDLTCEGDGAAAVTSANTGQWFVVDNAPRVVMTVATHNTQSYLQVLFTRRGV